MKRLLAVILFALCCTAPALALQPTPHPSASPAATAKVLNLGNKQWCAVDVEGTFTATETVYVDVDGGGPYANGTPVGWRVPDGTLTHPAATTTITAAGTVVVQVAGLWGIEVMPTAYTSGSPLAFINCSASGGQFQSAFEDIAPFALALLEG